MLEPSTWWGEAGRRGDERASRVARRSLSSSGHSEGDGKPRERRLCVGHSANGPTTNYGGQNRSTTTGMYPQ